VAGSMNRAYAGVSSSQQPTFGIKSVVAVESENVISGVSEDPQHPFVLAVGGEIEVISRFTGLRELQQLPALAGDMISGATTSSFSPEESQHPSALAVGKSLGLSMLLDRFGRSATTFDVASRPADR
jgi:hypothetical protein